MTTTTNSSAQLYVFKETSVNQADDNQVIDRCGKGTSSKTIASSSSDKEKENVGTDGTRTKFGKHRAQQGNSTSANTGTSSSKANGTYKAKMMELSLEMFEMMKDMSNKVELLQNELQSVKKTIKQRHRLMNKRLNSQVSAVSSDFALLHNYMNNNNRKIRKLFQQVISQDQSETAINLEDNLNDVQEPIYTLNVDSDVQVDDDQGSINSQHDNEEEEMSDNQNDLAVSSDDESISDEDIEKVYEKIAEVAKRWLSKEQEDRLPKFWNFLSTHNMNPRPFKTNSKSVRRDLDLTDRARFVNKYFENKDSSLPKWSKMIIDYLQSAEGSQLSNQFEIPEDFNFFGPHAIDSGLKETYAVFQNRLMDSYRTTVTNKHQSGDLKAEWEIIMNHVFNDGELKNPNAPPPESPDDSDISSDEE